MEAETVQKQMSSTNRKDKIFNVRRIHYKQFDHEKYLKPHFSPMQIKQNNVEGFSHKMNKKGGEYNFQVAIISSAAYKELNKKYAQLKEEQAIQKERKLNQMKIKEEQLQKYKSQKQRLDAQRERLLKKRDQLRLKLDEIHDRNEALREQQSQRNQEYRLLNMQYLKDMIISMRYQNGLDIDPDRMTYEQLLQLQEKMGNVSKGFPIQIIQKIPKIEFNQDSKPQLCSICYEDVKAKEFINKLECGHTFHCDCIKEWLLKERVCPMCKGEIMIKKQ